MWPNPQFSTDLVTFTLEMKIYVKEKFIFCARKEHFHKNSVRKNSKNIFAKQENKNDGLFQSKNGNTPVISNQENFPSEEN